MWNGKVYGKGLSHSVTLVPRQYIEHYHLFAIGAHHIGTVRTSELMGNAVLAVDGKLQPDAPQSAATMLRTFPRGAYTAFSAVGCTCQARLDRY